MIKILGVVLLCCLIFACLEFLLDHLLYTLIGIAIVCVMVKVKNIIFPKEVYIESEEEKKERQLERKEALMEQFRKLEYQTKKEEYLQCNMQEYSCLQELAQLGHIPAMMLLAKSKDADISIRYYMMASDAGEHQAAVKAFWRFIHRHQQNSMPDAFDITKIGERLRKGAEAGNADCMFALAMCYAKDFVGTFGTQYNYRPAKSPFSPNQEKLIFWLKKSFEQGCKNPGVQVLMAEYYATGKIWNDFHFEKEPIYISKEKCIDPKKAFAILEPIYQTLNMNFSYSPERGHWYQAAKYLMTMFYFDGFGTEPDSEKARACIHAGGEGNILTVTSKEKEILTAIRKELQEGLFMSYEKRLQDYKLNRIKERSNTTL